MKKLLITFTAIILGVILAFSYVNFNSERGNASTTRSSPTLVATEAPTPDIRPEPSVPTTINIPTLNVTAAIEAVGKDAEGKMDIPVDYYNAAWYSLGPKPGEKGNAVIAGHLDTPTGEPSIFYYLSTLQPGDEINVTDMENNTYTFEVVSVENFEDAYFPLQRVFGKQENSYLNLITCAGVFNSASSNYSHRTVVFSELKDSTI